MIETISRFLSESANAYPIAVGSPEMVEWPVKLASYADAFCTRRPDGSLSAALFAYLNTETCVGYIPFLCTLPECEKGTGYRLHEQYRQSALNLGIKALRLEVIQSNSHAIEFYKRQGYAIAGNRADRNRYLMELVLK